MNFLDAVTVILDHEGGYVHDKRDPGGETKFGISKRSYPDIDIAALTKVDVTNIYRADFWKPLNCDALPWPVALILFDHGVNAGIRRAGRMLQHVLGIGEDGIIGPETVAAAMKADIMDLCERLTTARVLYYSGLVWSAMAALGFACWHEILYILGKVEK